MKAPVQQCQPDIVEILRAYIPGENADWVPIRIAQAAEVIEQYRTDSASDEKLITALKSRVEELTKALEFYRDEWNINGDGDSSTPGLSRTWMEPTDELLNDEGRTARRALAPSLDDKGTAT